MKNLYFIISFFTLTCSFSQYDTGDSNYVGLFAGVNKTDILSKNFDVKPLLGWNAALSVRGNYYNDFEMVYAIQFAKNNFAIPSRNLLLKNEEAKYTLTSVQISFQLSYPIIENHLSVEFGPGFAVNGKLEFDKSQETNILTGNLLQVKDLQEISNFNIYPIVGVTAGFKNFRVNLLGQYGLLNIFDNVNNTLPNANLKGNLLILSSNFIVYF